METHSSILAWEIPWREEPGGLQSMGSQRVGHDWSYLAYTHTHTHTQSDSVPWRALAKPGNRVAANRKRPCLPCLYNTDHELHQLQLNQKPPTCVPEPQPASAAQKCI